MIAPSSNGPGPAAIRVLLVEDDDRLVRLTARYLDSHGLVVTRAAGGGSGLELARRGEFDLVLLDLMLPVRNGLEVCRELRATDDALTVAVSDRGIGITEADRERVFEPFFRSDRSRARGSGGIGLGPTLARRIVEAHGGTITLDSEADVGTRVEFTVARRPPA